MRCSRFVRALRAVVLVLLAWVTAPAFALTERPLALTELVRGAESIVVGTVVGARARWGDATRRYMLTDVEIAVDEVLFDAAPAATARTREVLTYWGGEIGGERQGIAGLVLPAVGTRYVFWLRAPAERDAAGFAPTVGANQGLFAITIDTATQRALLTSADRRPLTTGAAGPAFGTAGGEPLDLATLRTWLRANAASLRAAPPPPPRPSSSGPRLLPTFAKLPEVPSARPTVGADATDPAARVGTGIAGTPERAPAAAASVTVSPASAPARIGPAYSWRAPPVLPVIINSFPPSFTDWYPHDQYQMSRWNYYAQIFRVYTTPTGTFGWPNGIFDLAGWPSSGALAQVYGRGWGATELGVTFYRIAGCCIVEADVALNPAYAWTLDDEWTYDSFAAVSFRQTMMHELGHVASLEHSFNAMSLMNYFPMLYRAFSFPYADDAEAVRTAFPGAARALADLGVYMYYPDAPQSVADAHFPRTVLAGEPMTASHFFVENVGTTTIAAPTVAWYLSRQRNFRSGTPYYWLGDTTFAPPLPRFTNYTPSTVRWTFTVPAHARSGDYYLGAFVPNDGGISDPEFAFSNNYAFSQPTIRVVGRTTTQLLASPAVGTPDDVIALDALVDGTFGFTPPGAVAFRQNGQPIAACASVLLTNIAFDRALATCLLTGVSVGTHTFSATYAGREQASGATASVTIVPVPGTPCAGFADVDAASSFCTSVEWLFNRRITTGCGAGSFCPGAPVTRLAMAAFLHRLGTAMTPLAAIVSEQPGPQFAYDPGPLVCTTADIAVAGAARAAIIDAMVSFHRFAGGPSLRPRIVVSTDGGATWSPAHAGLPNRAQTGRWSGVRLAARADVPAGAQARFAVQLGVGPATTFVDLADTLCRLRVELENRDPPFSPF